MIANKYIQKITLEKCCSQLIHMYILLFKEEILSLAWR